MDLVVIAIAIYFIVLMLIGLSLRGVKSEEGFILANRQIKFPMLVATVVASFYGASAVIGGASITYQIGLGVLWFMIPFYLGNIFLIFVLPKIQKENVFTLPDFLGRFYGSRTVIASSSILAVLCLVPESIIAGGKILELVTPLSLEISMVLVFSVIVLYTLLGGMRSVIVSDLMQFGLMLLALIIIVPYMLAPTNLQFESLPKEFWNPFNYLDQETLVWCILLFFLPITSAPLYQRIFASAKGVNIKKAILYSVIIWIAIDAIVLLSGLVSSVNYELDDPDQAIFILGSSLLPPVLQAVFFIGLLSAVMSTADSFLHSGASSLAHDVYGGITGSTEVKTVTISRLLVIVLGFISLLLALYFQQIVPALIFLLTVWISGILVPTLSALLNYRLNEDAAFCSIVFGSAAAVIWRFLPLMEIDPLFIGLGCSLLVAVIVDKLR
ncbi:MAG: sodium:solute symporter family protein [Candidatus Altiarchaeota archaeon]|nr:sodium:solute symporter family protein [Candidatus Altiarchaeota archaeon]